MSHLEPGVIFAVEYGNDKKIDVVALSFRQKKAIVSLIKSVTQNIDPFENLEKAFRLCAASVDDSIFDVIDDRMMMDVIQKTLRGNTLSEDDKKKSESQRCCDQVNCVGHVEQAAEASRA